MTAIHPHHAWRKISPDDGNYFFGYYDRNPWNHDQTRHLVLKIDQYLELPAPGESAEIGVLDGQGGYEPLTSTRAWSPQQGSMQLFLPHRPGCFVYNDFDAERGKLLARVYEIGQGVVGAYEHPLYTISPDGKWGVSLNFGRIPRRGYSYADTPLSREWHPSHPDQEGIILVDLATGEGRLIVSYAEMLQKHPYGYDLDQNYIWLNHAIFNCDSSRLLWLFRQCANPVAMDPMWQTFMYTSSLSGEDAECVLPEVYWKDQISHQIWGRTPREILVDANWNGRGNEAVVFDESRRPFLAEKISAGHGGMSHMVFSPDGKWILSDSYPDRRGIETLALIQVATGEMEIVGRFRHHCPRGAAVDCRTDLHPRWSPDGRLVTVDSIHDGSKGVYLLDLSSLVG